MIEYILSLFKSLSLKVAATVDESNDANTFTTPHVISNKIEIIGNDNSLLNVGVQTPTPISRNFVVNGWNINNLKN